MRDKVLFWLLTIGGFSMSIVACRDEPFGWVSPTYTVCPGAAAVNDHSKIFNNYSSSVFILEIQTQAGKCASNQTGYYNASKKATSISNF